MPTNYAGAAFDWDLDKVLVWERSEEGRIVKAYKAPRYFFVPGEGEYKSIYGYKLQRLDFDSDDELRAAVRQHRDKHESDISPLYKVLMDEYYDRPIPIIHYAFIDMEADVKMDLGFSSPGNPYAPINAVTTWQSWTGKFITRVVPPPGWTGTLEDIYVLQAEYISQGLLRAESIPEIILHNNERELLAGLIEDIADSDIVSGWNSEFYDLPYIIQRLERVAPKLVQRLSFTGAPRPKERKVERFGTEEIVYQLFGRTHLDYLDLFKKFTFEGRTSYALGNILSEEVGISKLHFEGSFEDFYNKQFEKFTLYNFRDVDGLVQLNEKFKFIQLVNQMAHENTCLFADILGTVRYVETGITTRARYVHGLRVPDKQVMTDGEKVEGALVLTPKAGLHEWIGSVDIASLYPSVIRSLNISPEKFVGQFIEGEQDWRGIMIDGDDLPHLLKTDDGEVFEATGKEWKDTILEKKWAVSAYGTVFDESSGQGIVPETLTYWFTDRKRLQGEKKKYAKLAEAEKDPLKKVEYEKLVDDFDLLQLTKKIQLNSCYGALLSPYFRLGRKEMGASVTACGRQITMHMMKTIHRLAEGTDAKLEKISAVESDGKVSHAYTITGNTVIYGDTDSVDGSTMVMTDHGRMQISALFNASPLKWSPDGDREFATGGGKVMGFDGAPLMLPTHAIYRHRTPKRRFKIGLVDGKEVIVTEDHSLMIMRNGEMLAMKPQDIDIESDTCIRVGDHL